MGYMYNHGLVTSAKGASWEQLRLVCSDGSGTLIVAEDCGSGLIASVTRLAQGDYKLVFNKPYPPKIITCIAQHQPATKTTGLLNVRAKLSGYDSTNGTIEFFVSGADGTAAADPAQNDEISVIFNMRRYTANA